MSRGLFLLVLAALLGVVYLLAPWPAAPPPAATPPSTVAVTTTTIARPGEQPPGPSTTPPASAPPSTLAAPRTPEEARQLLNRFGIDPGRVSDEVQKHMERRFEPEPEP